MLIDHQIEHLDIIQQSARDFAALHIKPYVMEWDESQEFPKSLMEE